MSWLYLLAAGLFEIGWAIGLKYSDGLTRPLISAVTIVGMIASFFLLSLSMKDLPIGTAYGVWSGIGMAGTAILGLFLFNEPASAARISCILMVIIGTVGLKISG